MLKYALLAGAMIMAAPAVAQDTNNGQQSAPASAPVQTQTAPAQVPTAAPAQAAPARAAPQPADTAQSTAPAAPVSQPAQAAQAQPAPAADPAAAPAPQAADATPQPQATRPAASGNQVADVVNKEFPTYDKDSNGALSEPEFSAWMVALKTASDPSTKATDPATKAWVDKAFAQADTDKNKAVSKQELTGFLSQGASQGAGSR